MAQKIVAINYDCARISYDRTEPTLVVSGEVSNGGGTVSLEPVVYVQQPEYWQVDLLWDRTNALLTVITPFEVEIPVSAITGTKGIHLVGKSMSTNFDL